MKKEALKKRRNEATIRKIVYLTEETVQKIEYVQNNTDCSFSGAIEAMILAGEESDAIALSILLRSTIVEEMKRSTDRLAKLMVTSAINAGMASEIGMILLTYFARTVADSLNANGKKEVGTDELEKIFQTRSKTLTDLASQDFVKKQRKVTRIISLRTLRNPIMEWTELEKLIQNKKDEL